MENIILQNIVTDYSFYKSTINETKLTSFLKENNIKGAIITDYNNLNSLFSYSSLFKKNNLKFGIGIKTNLIYKENIILKVNLIIKTNIGYTQIIKNYNKIKTNTLLFSDIENSLQTNSLSLILDINEILKNNLTNEDLLTLSKHNNCSFYIGLNNTTPTLTNLLNTHPYLQNYPTIINQEITYLKKEDSEAFKYLYKMGLKKDSHLTNKEQEEVLLKNKTHYPSFEYITQTYLQETITNTNNLINTISFDIDKIKGEFPPFSDNDNDLLDKLVSEKLTNLTNKNEKYIERMHTELDIIKRTNFSTYFLIVNKIIQIANTNNILIGPGRGSSSSSLISYLLGITKVDPIKYNLTFSRFLNEKRSNPPDIDIDIEDTKRNNLLSLLEKEFENIAHIRTYQTLQCKSVLKALFEVFEINEYQQTLLLNSLSNNIESFEKEYKTNINFKKLINGQDETYKKLIQVANKLVNTRINSSIHPAGILINKDSLLSLLPTTYESNINVVDIEYPYLEEHNFLKIDLLSLTNLSFIQRIKENIYTLYYQNQTNLTKEEVFEKLKFENIDLEDSKVYKTLNNLHLANIFQLTSNGIKEVIKKDKIEKFSDLVNLLALYRPGPLDNIETYIKNKQNKDLIKYKNEKLKEILQDTYNTIIYQEQIIKIANILANFSEAESDLFRRAISKKDLNKIHIYKDEFIQNLITYSSFTKQEAINLYTTIENFANYGFNKAHSVSYSIITYTLLYFKTYYPKAFYLISLNDEQLNSQNFIRLVKEMKERELHLKQVSINFSSFNTYNIIDNNFYLPVKIIKKLTNVEELKELIETNTSNEKSKIKKYERLEQFLYDIKTKNIKEFITPLIYSGYLDKIIKSRLSLIENLDQLELFYEFLSNEHQEFFYPTKTIISDKLKINTILKEKEYTNIFLSSSIKQIFNLKQINKTIYIVYSEINYVDNYYQVKLVNENEEKIVKLINKPTKDIQTKSLVYLKETSINQRFINSKNNIYDSLILVKHIDK